MSEKIIDNFANIDDDEKLSNNNNCFDFEDKVELTLLGLSNNIKNMVNITDLLYSLSFSLDDDILGVFSSIDDITNNQGFYNKLKDIIVCYIFNELDFNEIFSSFGNLEMFNDFLLDVDLYKKNIENLSNFEDEEDILNLLDDETILEDIEILKKSLNSKLKKYIEQIIEYIFSNYKIDEKYRDRFLDELLYLDIEDFESLEDLKQNIKGVLKTVFVLDNSENQGIIGDKQHIKMMKNEDFVNVFTNTYTSIFEFILTDFSIDFSNIEDFLKNADTESSKNLRFLYYIFDSFKYDLEVVKNKLLQDYMINGIFEHNKDLGIVEVINKEFSFDYRSVSDAVVKCVKNYYHDDGSLKVTVSEGLKITGSIFLSNCRSNFCLLEKYFKNFVFMESFFEDDRESEIYFYQGLKSIFKRGYDPVANFTNKKFLRETDCSTMSSSYIITDSFTFGAIGFDVAVRRIHNDIRIYPKIEVWAGGDDNSRDAEYIINVDDNYRRTNNTDLYIFEDSFVYDKYDVLYDYIKGYNLVKKIDVMTIENDWSFVEIFDDFKEDLNDGISDVKEWLGF
jgi:hypothetical protein